MLYLTYAGRFHKLKPGTILIVTPNQNICKQVWIKELNTLNLGKYCQYINSFKELEKISKPICVVPYRFLIRQTRRGLALKRAGLGKRIDPKTGKSYFLGEQIYKFINKKIKPKFLIADEAHRLGDKLSQTSSAMRELSRRSKHVLALSGSPLDGYMYSLACVLSFVYGERNELFPYTVDEFDRLFSQTVKVDQDYKTGKSVGKIRKLPGVKASKLGLYFNSVSHLIHRLTDKDEMISKYVKYPNEIKQRVKVKLSSYHNIIYKHAISSRQKLLSLVKQVQSSAIDINKPGVNRAIALRELDYLKQIVNCPWNVLNNIGNDSVLIEEITKAQLCKSIVEKHLKAGEKGIIFIHNVAVGFYLREYLEKSLNIKTARIYARDPLSNPIELSLDQREKEIISFQNDEEIKVLITNTELSSEGLNLVEASYGIFYDYGWKSVTIQQAARRYARPGQVKPEVYTYYLEADETVDSYTLETLLAKSTTNSKVLDLDFSALLWNLEKSIEQEEISEIELILKKLQTD